MMEFIRGRRREGRTGSSDGFSLGLLRLCCPQTGRALATDFSSFFSRNHKVKVSSHLNKRTNCLEYREKCGLWPHHPISGGGLDNGKMGHLQIMTGEDPEEELCIWSLKITF